MMKRLLLALLLLIGFSAYANAAARFWVGGDGTWDNSTQGHWATTSNGSPTGIAPPTSSDTCTFDGNSGAGTGLGGGPLITVNANVTCSQFALGVTGGNFIGSIIFSTNNNSPTFSTFGYSGAGTRQLDLGNGTWTLNGSNGSVWDLSTVTGLTFNQNSAVINVTPSIQPIGARSFFGGGKTYSTVNFNADPTGAGSGFNLGVSGANTFTNLGITGPIGMTFGTGTTTTVTNAFSWNGSASNRLINIANSNLGATSTIAAGAASTMTWAVVRLLVFSTSAVTATNSFDSGGNSGTITITGPSGGAHIIGGYLLNRDIKGDNDNSPAWLRGRVAKLDKFKVH
jgi:hypothetical protein